MELFTQPETAPQQDSATTPQARAIIETLIYKGRDGWEAKSTTDTDANGKAWQISTYKRKTGVECYAIEGQDEGNGCFSFMMLGGNRLNRLAWQDGQCNEKKVREVHAAGLIAFQQHMKTQEPATQKYVLKVGQVIFTDFIQHSERAERVICEVIRPGHFKSVLIDGTGFKFDDHVRDYKEKFGIGVYYNEGETLPLETVQQLVKEATNYEASERVKAEERAKVAAEDRARKIEEGKKIIAELPAGAVGIISADNRTDTSDPQSDYHGYRTEETVYLAFSNHKRDLFPELRKAAANCTIEGVNRYATEPAAELYEDGTKRTPRDEHREKYSMGAGYYLGESKYSGWVIKKGWVPTQENERNQFLEKLQIAAAEGRYFVKEQEEGPTAPAIQAGELQIIDYSEKAVAVIGNTKPVKDILKAAGGRFNFRLTCGAGWIFPKTKLQELQTLLSA